MSPRKHRMGKRAEAVVSELVQTLEAPTGAVFEGQSALADRVRSLARSLSRFYERAEPWFHVHQRELGLEKAFAKGAREFDHRVERLIRDALGARGDDRSVLALRALMNPPVFAGLRRGSGVTAEEEADLVTEMAVAWLERGGGEGLG